MISIWIIKIKPLLSNRGETLIETKPGSYPNPRKKARASLHKASPEGRNLVNCPKKPKALTLYLQLPCWKRLEKGKQARPWEEEDDINSCSNKTFSPLTSINYSTLFFFSLSCAHKEGWRVSGRELKSCYLFLMSIAWMRLKKKTHFINWIIWCKLKMTRMMYTSHNFILKARNAWWKYTLRELYIYS